MATLAANRVAESLRTLPGDDVRQILWGFADRFDLQMLVQSARAVARGPVARLVAAGRTQYPRVDPGKAMPARGLRRAGITAAFMDPEQGGFIAGPKNLALALVAFELAWVDAGAATGSLAGCLALGAHPRARHARAASTTTCAAARPPQPGEDRGQWRGAFCLTEPIPYVGVETGMLGGKVASPSGKTAKSRFCRWKSAAASSPTWASPTS